MSSSAEKLLASPVALCNMVRRIAIDAGEIALNYYDILSDEHIEKKDDGSPVTLADREVETFVHISLKTLLPDVPIIGEEAAAHGDLPDIQGQEYFWLVDPIDGTAQFIRGHEDFTVNIALIKDGFPVLGVVYAPARGELYAGSGPNTALRWSEETGKDKQIAVSEVKAEGLRVVASGSKRNDALMEEFLSAHKVAKVTRRGSSIKFCDVAVGKADLYPNFGPCYEWDTAAGQAVIEAAGGFLQDMNGERVSYGRQSEKFASRPLTACSFDLHESLNDD